MPAGPQSSDCVAIVGASSLRGKELKAVLEDRNFPASEIILLDESPMAVEMLTEAGGEPHSIRPLEEGSFERARFVFFAGSTADAERNWQTAQRSGSAVIDLTGALSASGRAFSWIPSLSSVLLPRPGAGANGGAHPPAYHSPPPPV